MRFVYDGSTGRHRLGPDRVAVRAAITPRRGCETEPTPFDGRSDYGPFLDVGVPAGGLFSGAENVKTPEQAAVYGGTAGEPYDSCYHEACDDIHNLSSKALFELGDGVAHSVLTLAKTKSGFFEDGSKQAKTRRRP